MYSTRDIHHAPNSVGCYKVIVVIIGRAHCFLDYINTHTHTHRKLLTLVNSIFYLRFKNA